MSNPLRLKTDFVLFAVSRHNMSTHLGSEWCCGFCGYDSDQILAIR